VDGQELIGSSVVRTFATLAEEDAESGAFFSYAGSMFDIKGRSDIEITSIGFTTRLNTTLGILVYVREGGYAGYEDDIAQWTLRANVTVEGKGKHDFTSLPRGSFFEPLTLRKSERLGVYLTSDGPYVRAARGDVEGRRYNSNNDVVIYEGVSKYYPADRGTISPALFNGAFEYFAGAHQRSIEL